MSPAVGGTRSSTEMFDPARLETFLVTRLPSLRGAQLCVAYSGGMDSHVLLHALAALRARCGFALQALHVDHGIHPESVRWAGHCRAVCAGLDVPFDAERVHVPRGAGRSLENEARRARYASLAARLAPGACLLTAHHRDDQAETVLLMLMRGAGVRGLAAMRAAQRFGPGHLLRPLLDVTRTELAAYAANAGLTWIDDLGNRDLRLSRNYVRHVVLPALSRHWPGAAQTLARCAAQARGSSDLLDGVARDDLAPCRIPCPGLLPLTVGCLSVTALRRLPAERRGNALRYWLRELGLAPPPAKRLEEALEQLLRRESRGSPCVEWGGAQLRRYRDALAAMDAAPPPPPQPLAWPSPRPLHVAWAAVRLVPRPVTGAGVSRAAWDRSAVVTTRPAAGRCRPAGSPHHRRLKVLFQELGIPPWERDRLPVLLVDGEAAWLPGIGACHRHAAAPGEEGFVIDLQYDLPAADAQFH